MMRAAANGGGVSGLLEADAAWTQPPFYIEPASLGASVGDLVVVAGKLYSTATFDVYNGFIRRKDTVGAICYTIDGWAGASPYVLTTSGFTPPTSAYTEAAFRGFEFGSIGALGVSGASPVAGNVTVTVPGSIVLGLVYAETSQPISLSGGGLTWESIAYAEGVPGSAFPTARLYMATDVATGTVSGVTGSATTNADGNCFLVVLRPV